MDITLLLSMGLLLLLAKVFGEIAEEIGFSSLIGEVLAGIVLVAIFGITLGAFTEDFLMLAVVILLFMAGLNVKYEEIRPNIYHASIITAAGVLLTFALCMAFGLLLFNSILIGIAMGAILVSTSDAVVFSILMKMGNMKSGIGKMIISTTIVDDVAGILFLSLMTMSVVSSKIAFSQIWTLLMISIGFYVVLLIVGSKIINVFMKIFSSFRDEYIWLALPLVIAILISVVAENIGLGMATGAFIAGMMMANNKNTETNILPRIKVISNGFIVPLFFAVIGTMIIIADISWFLVGIILLISIFGKTIGCAFGSFFARFSGNDSNLIGLSMIPRGDYNIIVAQIALTLGIITKVLFSSTITAIILTMIITPVLIRFLVKKSYS